MPIGRAPRARLLLGPRRGIASAAWLPSRLARGARRVAGAYAVAEGAAYAHHLSESRRARAAPLPAPSPADPEYSSNFLALARCDPREGRDVASEAAPSFRACARFVRHAFFGTPPEELHREHVAGWLRRHVGHAADDAVHTLMAGLGPHAPQDAAASAEHPSSFAYGEGPIEAFYKPLPLKCLVEFERQVARWRLRTDGFTEHRDPDCPLIRFWERPASDASSGPPLVLLHGYGRGLASPFLWKLVPELDLGGRRVVIVDCSWLLVTRVPAGWDITETPTVREIAAAAARFLEGPGGVAEIDVIGHSFGTAVASALMRELAGASSIRRPGRASSVSVRRCVLMDPMCFMPGITKQAQLLRRPPGDVAAELLQEVDAGPPPSYREVLKYSFSSPDHCGGGFADEAEAIREKRWWVIFQTYRFFYFIFRDLVYSWVNARSLQGADYLDRGHLRALNRDGRLLSVIAETDMLIPAGLLRDELGGEAPSASPGGVLWLPVVGHGACQHRSDVAERIRAFLSVA